MNASSKRITIQILFGVIVALIIANIVYKKYFTIEIPSEKGEVSASSIEKKFLNNINSFGFKNEWITKTKYSSAASNEKIDDSLKAYKISVPEDLPITVIINEINSSLKNDNVEIISKEEKINGKTKLFIYSKNILKLYSVIDYNNETRRKAGYVGIVISSLENLNEDEVDQILNFPELFGYYVIPSKESSLFVKKHLKLKKEYLVLLGDDIDDLKFKLKVDYSERRLKESIRSIIGAFPNASLILIDDNSELYNSSIFNFISDEFKKRNIKLINKSQMSDISNESKNQVQSSFRNIVKSNNSGWGKAIIVSAENFDLVKDEIIKLRKIGYKFINPSQILLNAE